MRSQELPEKPDIRLRRAGDLARYDPVEIIENVQRRAHRSQVLHLNPRRGKRCLGDVSLRSHCHDAKVDLSLTSRVNRRTMPKDLEESRRWRSTTILSVRKGG